MDNLELTLSRTDDLLAYIPYALGFQPRESLVILALEPGLGAMKAGPLARVDLGDLLSVQGPPDCLSSVTRLFADQGARAFVVVIYLDDSCVDAIAPARLTQVASCVAHDLGAVRLGWAAWVVTRSDFAALDTSATRARTGPARSLRMLDMTVCAATMVARGVGVLPDRRDLANLPAVQVADAAGASRAQREWYQRRDSSTWRADSFQAWVEALAGRNGQVAPTLAGRLAAGVRDTAVRDAVLAHIVAPRTLVSAPGEWISQGAEVSEVIAAATSPGQGERPTAEWSQRCSTVAARAAALAGTQFQAPLMTVLGWTCWWSGWSVAAGLWLERALEQDPGYRLAVLLRAALSVGLRPGWAVQHTHSGVARPGLV